MTEPASFESENEYLEPCGCLHVREVFEDGTVWVPYLCPDHEWRPLPAGEKEE